MTRPSNFRIRQALIRIPNPDFHPSDLGTSNEVPQYIFIPPSHTREVLNPDGSVDKVRVDDFDSHITERMASSRQSLMETDKDSPEKIILWLRSTRNQWVDERTGQIADEVQRRATWNTDFRHYRKASTPAEIRRIARSYGLDKAQIARIFA